MYHFFKQIYMIYLNLILSRKNTKQKKCYMEINIKMLYLLYKLFKFYFITNYSKLRNILICIL